jgi:hypothetical protein
MKNKPFLPLLVAALMAILSLAGLFFQSALYPTEDVQRAFVSNDVVNLLIGLPILLISYSLARCEKMLGVLLLPGALLYVTYNYIAYSVSTWMSVQSFFYIALVGLSVWGALQSVSNMDRESIREKPQGTIPNRFARGVLTVFGLLFFLRAVAEFFDGAAGMSAFGVLVADLLITPLWILGGVSLRRRWTFGYVAGAGLLFQASMLFVGLLIFFLLQPVLTGAPFPATDFAVIFGMGLFFFIPFGLSLKRVWRSS